MTRAWGATVAAVTKAWRVLVRLVRLGLLRQVVIVTMMALAVLAIVRQDYDQATLVVAWAIYMEITDPSRPAGLRVRRKR